MTGFGDFQDTAILPVSQVEELIRTIVKGLRAFQMYLPNNPIYHRAAQAIKEAFQPVWTVLDELVLTVAETDFVWEEQVVYHQLSKGESLAWGLYKDGMRILTLRKGVEEGEIVRFLEIVQRARTLPADAGDDLLTLLWEHEFSFISYQFTEFFADAAPILGGGAPPASGSEVSPEQAKQAVQEEAPPKPSGVIELEDFDSTLYWLDEAEIQYIAKSIVAEYAQDLRANALTILFDIFEFQGEKAVHGELVGILEHLLPNLLNAGDFRSVATILRESRLEMEKMPNMAGDLRTRLDAFTNRLSEPAVLGQVLQSIDEATTPPTENDLGELFKELRPSALETALTWLPKLSSPRVRELLEGSADRLAEANPREVLRLLRLPESEALVSTVELCRRLKLQSAVPGLGDSLGHSQAPVRLASVLALAAIATPGALAQIDRAVDDADRDVRLAAVREVGRKGYKGSLRRVEPVVQGKLQRPIDLTERMAFFEAYALIAGPSALDPLTAMLIPGGMFKHKEPPETRACAALALGKLRTPEAREVLQRAAGDKELVVRNAVSRALREASA
jgi:hypothetical protein